jgi:hypothetical protein
MKILLKIMDEFSGKKMNSLWIFEMMTLCVSHMENEKCGLKKNVIKISKLKLKNRPL